MLLLLHQSLTAINGTPDSRTYTVPYQDRTYTVPHQSRTYLAGGVMSASNKFTKDPDAILDFVVDWATADQYGHSWLNGDVISTSTWTVSAGLTIAGQSYTTGAATVWLSDGTNGQVCYATNRIITAGGRTDDRTLIITIKDQ